MAQVPETLAPEARDLFAMLEAGLVECRHVVRWSDDLVETLDQPPPALLGVSLSTGDAAAARALYALLDEVAFEFTAGSVLADVILASLLLCRRRGDFGWERFLYLAMEASEHWQGGLTDWEAARLLDDYRRAWHPAALERAQAAQLEARFAGVIPRLELLHRSLLERVERAG